MEHLVTFRTAEGRDGHHIAGGLEDALRFVERLHNSEEASGIRLHRMQEVPIEFKTYVKVEVRGEASPADPPADDEPGEEPAPALIASTAGADSELLDGPSRRLFSRS